jgi:hypothetical protein
MQGGGPFVRAIDAPLKTENPATLRDAMGDRPERRPHKGAAAQITVSVLMMK